MRRLKYFTHWNIVLNSISALVVVIEAHMGIIREITPDKYEPYLLLAYILMNLILTLRNTRVKDETPKC